MVNCRPITFLGFIFIAICESAVGEEPSWTWLHGRDMINYYSIYGTTGVADPDNWPGACSGSATWTTPDGQFWQLGGGRGYTNCLWRFSPASSSWACVSGPRPLNQRGSYGTLGVEDPANTPGARRGAATWVDPQGRLWLIGGDGEDAKGLWGLFNDLWRYNPATGCWAWIAGSQFVNQKIVSGRMGETGPTFTPGGLRGASTWVDAQGRLWLFGGYGYDDKNFGYLNNLWRFDLQTGNWTWVRGNFTINQMNFYGPLGVPAYESMPGARMRACAWMTSDGLFWLYGGVCADGLRSCLWSFDPETELWTWVKGGGWYQNQAAVYGTLGQPDPQGSPGGRAFAAGWTGTDDKLWLMGGQGIDAYGVRTFLNDLWQFDPATGNWTWFKGLRADAEVQDFLGKAGPPGAEAPAYAPGARWNPNTWVDQTGRLWLLGGYRLSTSIDWESLNDLWRFDPATGNWAWIKGYNKDFAGLYGTQGEAAPGNTPGARRDCAAWTDSHGQLWLFGGTSYDIHDLVGTIDDLWRLDPGSGTWTWVTGSHNLEAPPIYTEPGVENPNNTPGGRQSVSSWIDKEDRLWLFGGGSWGTVRNDLWRYDPAKNVWVWVKGEFVSNTPGTFGGMGVEDPGSNPGSRWEAMSWLDGAGVFWMFGGWGYGSPSKTPGLLGAVWRFDPATECWTWVNGTNFPDQAGVYGERGIAEPENHPGNRSAGASWIGRDGRMWLFGGNGLDQAGAQGVLNDLWFYDPGANMWTWVKGPSVVNQPGVYGEQGVAAPENTPGARSNAVTWTDRAGRFWLFGGSGIDAQAGSKKKLLNDLWFFEPWTQKWTWFKGETQGNQFGRYGAQGVTVARNTPGSLQGAAAWTALDGKMWLFGGNGYAPAGHGMGLLIDLWRLDPPANGVRGQAWARYE